MPLPQQIKTIKGPLSHSGKGNDEEFSDETYDTIENTVLVADTTRVMKIDVLRSIREIWRVLYQSAVAYNLTL
ncbi:hypothetical protein KIN20_031726 [Parelaphostrongylus tenuis]|uniref:Uncharacterized protein n=1 Tax=Parelaphostrongylus tenuis TaxID=148309 RepID=A0AAD5R787_PARTN|nr:hypothetical protein KIN20_031726 [Parelaphostrongylus tenuis]